MSKTCLVNTITIIQLALLLYSTYCLGAVTGAVRDIRDDLRRWKSKESD
jgi:hypothetical protein